MLAEQGHALTLLNRPSAHAHDALQRVTQLASGPAPTFIPCDFSEASSIAEASRRLTEQLPRIDVLIHNAGAIVGQRKEASDGSEYTFALNALGYFRLTAALLPLVEQGKSPRIVMVASDSHRGARPRLDDIDWNQRPYNALQAYMDSKLANICLAYALARRVHGRGIAVHALCPGATNSEFAKGDAGITGWAYRVARRFMRSPARAARTVVFAATSPTLEGQTGLYIVRGKPRRSSARSYDEALQEQLWELCTSRLGLPSDLAQSSMWRSNAR